MVLVGSPDFDNLREMFDYSEETVRSILSSLGSARPSLDLDSLATEVATETGLKQSVLQAQFELFSLVHIHCEEPEDDFEDRLLSTLNELASRFDMEDVEKKKEMLRKYIVEAFKLDSALGLSTKAQEVILESEHLFRRCRIVTDIRPIFMDGPKAAPDFATMIHNLTVAYYQNNNPFSIKSTTFVLDSDDLQLLKAAVDRAIEKEETIKKQSLQVYKEVIL